MLAICQEVNLACAKFLASTFLISFFFGDFGVLLYVQIDVYVAMFVSVCVQT